MLGRSVQRLGNGLVGGVVIKRSAMTVGSVCSGIGAPECAWRDFGWQFAWQAEIEAFPSAVLAERFPGTPNLGDMTAIAARVIAGEIEAPDVLVGGTPCQSFSVAGLRGGLNDERGNLALEFVRLANAIDIVRRAAEKPPAWIVWENVPGVLSDAGNAFGCVLAGLVGDDAPVVPVGRWTDAGVVDGPARRAAWRILDAQHFGLAQRRERIFVLARAGAGDWSAADALLPLVESRGWHPAPRREAGERPAPTVARGSPGGRSYGLDADTCDSLIPLAFGGNNRSGPIDVATARVAHGGPHGRLDFESETFIAHTLRASGFDASEDGTGRGTPLVAVAAPLTAGGHPNSNAPGRRKEDDVNLVRQPITFGAQNSATQGDGVTFNAVATLDKSKVPAVCCAILRGSFSGGAGGRPEGDASGHFVSNAAAVRRLTPRECERLQGFPDDWTAITYRGKPAADGPRYKALGNSMAVPVLRWIGRRIAECSA